jgi:MHS family proline/betaine transporter-like MFS transporter
MNISTPTPQLSDDRQHSLRKLALAVGVGNFLEWYDFGIYGLLAVTMGQLFFSSSDPVTSTMNALGVFSIGFIFRPAGAILLGIVGDKYGRRTALVITVIGMGLATVFIGFIPTYQEIGLAAPALLLLARAIQGLSAGADWTTSAVYLIESAPADKRGRYGSIMGAAASLSLVFGIFFSMALNHVLTHEQMLSFGWRIPFWFSGLLVVVGLVIRLKVGESPVFTVIERQKDVGMTGAELGPQRNGWMPYVVTMAFSIVHGVSYYYVAAYTVNFLQVTVHVAPQTALLLMGAVLPLHAVACFVVGSIIDRFGRRGPAIIAALGCVILTVPAFALMGTGNNQFIILGLVILICTQAFANVSSVVLLVELFLARSRATSSALAFNIAVTIVAGPAPYAAAWLNAWFGSAIAGAFYLVVTALPAAIVLILLLPETKGWSLGPRSKEMTAQATAR